MSKINFEKIIVNILRAALLAVVFVLPFVVTPQTIYPFVFGKTLFFQSAIEILFALFVVIAILKPEHRPRLDVLNVLVLGYFGILALATALGVDFYRSLWGTEERGLGLFTQLHFAAFFIMIRSLFNGERLREHLLSVSVLAGIGLSAVALLRLKGILIFGVDLGLRLSSTLANPLFFASVLVFCLSFSLYLAAAKRGIIRAVYAIAAILFLVMIIATQTRGAIVALGAGAVFFILSSFVSVSSRRIRASFLALLVLMAAVIALFWINRESQFVKHTPILSRFSALADTTASTRLIAWKIAFNAFRERPVLGWGPENFHIAFNKYYEPKLLEFGYYETWWDRPHNMALEVLVHSGMIGLAVYLSIFSYSVLGLIRRKTVRDRILAAGLIVYFVQNLFVFDTPSSLLLFMIMLSFVSGGGASSGQKTEDASREERKINLFFVLGAAVLSLSLAGFMVWKYNWKAFAASKRMLGAALYAADTSDVESMKFFKLALAMPTQYKEETVLQISQITNGIFSKKTIPPERFNELFSFAETAIKANIARHPRHAYYHFMLGRLYTEALNYDNSYGQKGEESFRRALELSPKRQQIWFGLAKLYLNLGRADEATAIYKKAIELAPRIGEAHWFYGVMLRDKGELEEAKKEMVEAANLGYIPPGLEERLFFARLMATEKNYPRVADYLESALQIEPKRADLWAQLAVAYKEYARLMYKEGKDSAGDKYIGWARDYAKKAAVLDPSFAAESQAFLDILDKEFKK